jgi:hypothetical protein
MVSLISIYSLPWRPLTGGVHSTKLKNSSQHLRCSPTREHADLSIPPFAIGLFLLEIRSIKPNLLTLTPQYAKQSTSSALGLVRWRLLTNCLIFVVSLQEIFRNSSPFPAALPFSITLPYPNKQAQAPNVLVTRATYGSAFIHIRSRS